MIEKIEITFDAETKALITDLVTAINELKTDINEAVKTKEKANSTKDESPTQTEPETSSNEPKKGTKKNTKAKQKDEPKEEQNEELKSTDVIAEETPIQLFEVIKLINEYAKKTSVDDAKKFVAQFGVRGTKELNQDQLNEAHKQLMKLLGTK